MRQWIAVACAVGLSIGVAKADRIDDLEKKIDALIATQNVMQTQIAELQAKDLNPSSANVATVAAAPTSQPAMSNTRVNRAGPWIVTVLSSIAPPDPGPIQSQLIDQQKRMPKMQNALADAQRVLAEMQAETVEVAHNYNHDQYGNYSGSNSVSRPKYSTSQLEPYALTVQRDKDDLQRVRQDVARLQHELNDATNTWSVTATQVDGSAIQIVGTGPVAKSLVQTMMVGSKYQVEGTSTMPNGMLTVSARAVKPVQ